MVISTNYGKTICVSRKCTQYYKFLDNIYQKYKHPEVWSRNNM